MFREPSARIFPRTIGPNISENHRPFPFIFVGWVRRRLAAAAALFYLDLRCTRSAFSSAPRARNRVRGIVCLSAMLTSLPVILTAKLSPSYCPLRVADWSRRRIPQLRSGAPKWVEKYGGANNCFIVRNIEYDSPIGVMLDKLFHKFHEFALQIFVIVMVKK